MKFLLYTALLGALPISCTAAPAQTEPKAQHKTQLAAAPAKADVTTPAKGDNQLFNLAEKPKKPRFEITEKVWPKNVGEADISLWRDDKLAAFSFTIDDNQAPDVDWWLEQGQKYKFPFTWFLITERISDKPDYWGTWEQWRNVLAQGHGLESHTMTHLHTELPQWKSIEWEYEDSLKMLEENLPNYKVSSLAYPGGKNSKLNKREVAVPLYIAARGTTGTLNEANTIDYLSVNGNSGMHLDGPKAPWANARNLIDKTLYNGRGYRGWGVILIHKANREGLQPFFDFLDKNREEIWVGLFTDVAKYGQERDTATLKIESNEANRIAFSVADKMDDTRFETPLTVKVRVPDAWNSVIAKQNDKAVETKLIEHEGDKFALVQAVPDKGSVSLSAK